MNDIRLYEIRLSDWNNPSEVSDPTVLSDEDFITEAERQGGVYTLRGFENLVNNGEDVFSDSFIRFTNVNSIVR
jgi:hypothetical protein